MKNQNIFQEGSTFWCLLVDIENVTAEFLNSQYRLAQAMQKLGDECGLDLDLLHCHTTAMV